MAEFAIAMMIAGTAIKASSEYKQGKEERKLYNEQAAITEEQAKAVSKASEHQERAKRKEGRRYVARQKVLFAKSGVRPKVGTPLLVMAETEKEFMKEAAFIQEGGATEVSRLRSEAAIERRMGKMAYKAGKSKAMSTVMTGLGQMGMFAYGQGSGGGGGSNIPLRSGATMQRRSQWLSPQGAPYYR